MRLPRSMSRSKKSDEPTFANKSDAAMAGSVGDGKEHDLQYWLDSGFLTLPKARPEDAAAVPGTVPTP